MTWKVLAVAALIGAFATACGNDDDPDLPPTPAVSTTATATATEPASATAAPTPTVDPRVAAVEQQLAFIVEMQADLALLRFYINKASNGDQAAWKQVDEDCNSRRLLVLDPRYQGDYWPKPYRDAESYLSSFCQLYRDKAKTLPPPSTQNVEWAALAITGYRGTTTHTEALPDLSNDQLRRELRDRAGLPK